MSSSQKDPFDTPRMATALAMSFGAVLTGLIRVLVENGTLSRIDLDRLVDEAQREAEGPAMDDLPDDMKNAIRLQISMLAAYLNRSANR